MVVVLFILTKRQHHTGAIFFWPSARFQKYGGFVGCTFVIGALDIFSRVHYPPNGDIRGQVVVFAVSRLRRTRTSPCWEPRSMQPHV